MFKSIKALFVTLLVVVLFTVMTAFVVIETEEKREANKETHKAVQLVGLMGDDKVATELYVDYPYQVMQVEHETGEHYYILESRVDRGYGGEIGILVLLNEQSEVQGIRLMKPHKETPGLGDVVEMEKSAWLLQFNDKSLESLPVDQWALERDGGVFDSVSGATVTARAVTFAVQQALVDWRKVTL